MGSCSLLYSEVVAKTGPAGGAIDRAAVTGRTLEQPQPFRVPCPLDVDLVSQLSSQLGSRVRDLVVRRWRGSLVGDVVAVSCGQAGD